MRCEDLYGHRPERDGPILVGIFIGKQLPMLIVKSSDSFSLRFFFSFHHFSQGL